MEFKVICLQNTFSESATNIACFLFQNVVRKIEKTVTGSEDRPVKEVKIANTKVEVVAEPFAVTKESAI